MDRNCLTLYSIKCSIFFVFSLLVCCQGECFFDAKGTCKHNGQLYGIGETWLRKDCYECTCLSPFGVGCCDVLQPVDYPEWCEMIKKPDTCSTVIVMKTNHKITCHESNSHNRFSTQRRNILK
ncbi:prostate-associated microseminoprotein-like isoform X2 [Protopterus annectens]|uniref:prostate-associated microseminoprotein-like isoform X2 n=1 Tax=Protopterus annectens TaxID=7888 RepID=UPI001CF9C999|nr:prostate-associated microseminoprotein-like isoform X2 [Protopterus annectens]